MQKTIIRIGLNHHHLMTLTLQLLHNRHTNGTQTANNIMMTSGNLRRIEKLLKTTPQNKIIEQGIANPNYSRSRNHRNSSENLNRIRGFFRNLFLSSRPRNHSDRKIERVHHRDFRINRNVGQRSGANHQEQTKRNPQHRSDIVLILP